MPTREMDRFVLPIMTIQHWITRTLLFLLLSASSLTLAQDAPWRIEQTPNWVKPIEPWSTTTAEFAVQGGGIEMHLYDRQKIKIRDRKPASFIAYEYSLANRIGVENYSSVDIEFDPIYQSLQLHEVSIMRNNRVIDKLPNIHASLLHREQELESLIFDGKQTLHLVVPDVRVGDVLRVAYTLEGSNPIFGDLFETGVSTERSSSSLARSYFRLETDADEPIHIREHGRSVEYQIIRNGDTKEYIVDQLSQPVHEEEDNVHPRFYNRGVLVFSNVGKWQDVVNWALPLYQINDQIPDELLQVASEIRQIHTSKTARIGAALRWVQDEIRYFGVELGADSHQPASPEQTLQRRFGDCKGKTQLLIALLKALGIDSNPALADTSEDLISPNFPWFLHAFDHVIVHVDIDGTSHWLDPTLTYQRGAVGEFYEPDYASALIVAPRVTGLSPMQNSFSSSKVTTLNHLDLPSDATQPIELRVNTIRTGRQAEYFRREQESVDTKELGKQYTKYYRDIYDGLVQQAPLVQIDQANNRFSVQEHYQLQSIWQTADSEKYRWLWANDLISWLEDPPESWERTQPFRQSHPVDISEQWTVSMQRQHEFDSLDKRIETPWFTFEKSHTLDSDGTELVVTMRYTSHSDHVLTADLDDYGKRVEEVKDNASFLIYEREPDGGFIAEFKRAMSEDTQDMSDTDILLQHAHFGGLGIGTVIAGVVVLRRRLGQKSKMNPTG